MSNKYGGDVLAILSEILGESKLMQNHKLRAHPTNLHSVMQ